MVKFGNADRCNEEWTRQQSSGRGRLSNAVLAVLSFHDPRYGNRIQQSKTIRRMDTNVKYIMEPRISLDVLEFLSAKRNLLFSLRNQVSSFDHESRETTRPTRHKVGASTFIPVQCAFRTRECQAYFLRAWWHTRRGLLLGAGGVVESNTNIK